MSQESNSQAAGGNAAGTTTERTSDRELVVTRRFDAPARHLFKAWTTAELFRQWWIPKSFGLTLVSCKMDARVGGGYRLEIAVPGSEQIMAFYGTYIEVVPDTRLSWTNEESPDGAVTTVTFAEHDGKTTVVVHDLYPSKEALDSEIASGATSGMRETLEQLEIFLGGFPKV